MGRRRLYVKRSLVEDQVPGSCEGHDLRVEARLICLLDCVGVLGCSIPGMFECASIKSQRGSWCCCALVLRR